MNAHQNVSVLTFRPLSTYLDPNHYIVMQISPSFLLRLKLSHSKQWIYQILPFVSYPFLVILLLST